MKRCVVYGEEFSVGMAVVTSVEGTYKYVAVTPLINSQNFHNLFTLHYIN